MKMKPVKIRIKKTPNALHPYMATIKAVGTYGYDDPGSDYGFGKTINVSFEDCREKNDSHGDEAWRHHLSAEDWDKLYGYGKQEEKAA